MILKKGILYEQNSIAWTREMLDVLAQLATPKGSSTPSTKGHQTPKELVASLRAQAQSLRTHWNDQYTSFCVLCTLK